EDNPEVIRAKDGKWRPDDLTVLDICSGQELKAVSVVELVEELYHRLWPRFVYIEPSRCRSIRFPCAPLVSAMSRIVSFAFILQSEGAFFASRSNRWVSIP